MQSFVFQQMTFPFFQFLRPKNLELSLTPLFLSPCLSKPSVSSFHSIVTIKNISRHCQMSSLPGWQHGPWWRSTAVTIKHASWIFCSLFLLPDTTWLASLLGQVSVSNIILTWTSHPTLIPCQLYMVLSFSVPFTVVLHYPLTISKCFLQCRESTIRIKTVGPFVYSTPERWDDLSDWHVW